MDFHFFLRDCEVFPDPVYSDAVVRADSESTLEFFYKEGPFPAGRHFVISGFKLDALTLPTKPYNLLHAINFSNWRVMLCGQETSLTFPGSRLVNTLKEDFCSFCFIPPIYIGQLVAFKIECRFRLGASLSLLDGTLLRLNLIGDHYRSK